LPTAPRRQLRTHVGRSNITDCVTIELGGQERDHLHPSRQVAQYQRYLLGTHPPSQTAALRSTPARTSITRRTTRRPRLGSSSALPGDRYHHPIYTSVSIAGGITTSSSRSTSVTSSTTDPRRSGSARHPHAGDPVGMLIVSAVNWRWPVGRSIAWARSRAGWLPLPQSLPLGWHKAAVYACIPYHGSRNWHGKRS
jgi:hypothetical protein